MSALPPKAYIAARPGTTTARSCRRFFLFNTPRRPNPFALRSLILSAPCRGCIGTAAGAPANGHLLQMCDLFVHLPEFALRGHLHKIVASSARDSLVIRFSELAKSSNFLSSQASSKRKSIHMITRRIAIFAALSVAFYPVLPALPASDPDLLAGLDTDNDGTVSVDEAKKAAQVVFDKLDRDHDGTLTGRELRGRLSAKEFTAADADKDGTLSKDEYLAVVEQRFKAADTDNDGTLTRRELRSKAGRQLLLLLR